MSPVRFRPPLIALGLCALSACAESDAEGPRVITTDSVGVTVVHSRAPLWGAEGGEGIAEGDAWFVGEPTLVLDGREGDDFSGVADALRLHDGQIAVADAGRQRVVVFGPEGRPRAVVGGEGDGPGEFRLMQRLGAAGDSVWVYDFSHRRVTWLGADGSVLDLVTLTPSVGSAVAVGRLPDGRFLLAAQWGSGEGAPQQGLVRDHVPFVRYAPDGELLDTVGRFPGREVLHRADETGRMVMSAVPFGRTTSRAVVGGVVVVGDQVTHELRVLAADGRPTRIVRWDGPALGLDEDDREAWVERQVELAPTEEREATRVLLSDTPMPDRRPAYGPVLGDEEGFLWVGAYAHPGDEPVRWDVFTPEGRWLGPIQMPTGFRPLRAGNDWVLGVRRDALDVERVEVRGVGPGSARDGERP